MKDRKLFCLIRHCDLPEAHAEADKRLEMMANHQCGCGWPEQPCLSMHPQMRQQPIIKTVTKFFSPAWSMPWNKKQIPVRHP